jgi:predicted PolB exonuclease-like 3'-5' exonuclease
MMNIQNEVQKIHNQYGMSEKANYKIQLLCEQYAKEYHDSEVKKLNIPAVVGLKLKDNSNDRKWVCQKCGELVDGRNVTFEEYHEGCGGRCV